MNAGRIATAARKENAYLSKRRTLRGDYAFVNQAHTEESAPKEENELELILQCPKRSWLAIGWISDDVVQIDTIEATGDPAGFVDALVTSAPQPVTLTNVAISVELPVVSDEPASVLAETCFGEMRWPSDCTECRYHLSWSYSEDTQLIDFSLETQLPPNSWSGVGFSQSSAGVGADVFVVKSLGNQISIADMHVDEYGNFVLDDSQNHLNHTVVGSHSDGILRAAFSRPRTTLEKHDAQTTDQHCYYMIFYVEGGHIGSKGEIMPPAETARISQDKVCIKPCAPTTSQTYCPREFKYPADCTKDDCEYQAVWDYDIESDKVTFTVSSRTDGKRWTGIGFSRTGSMAIELLFQEVHLPLQLNSDIVIGWVHNGQAVITDRFAYGKHQPAIDKFQDIFDVSGRFENGVQTITFSRNVTTTDHREDLPLAECLYFLFPVGGGPLVVKNDDDFLSSKAMVGYHDVHQPIVSPQPICLLCDQTKPTLEPDSAGKNAGPKMLRKRQTTNNNALDFACNDVITIAAFGKLSRVSAPPQSDSAIVWADGHDVDGRTTIALRHKLDTSKSHLLPNDRTTLLWAKEEYTIKEAGQNDNPLHDTEVKNPMITFNAMDSYKSGKFLINFFERNPDKESTACSGAFKFPENCNKDNCQYSASWNRYGNDVEFSLAFNGIPTEWSAIGFSKNGSIVGSDVVVMSILPDSKVEVTDRFTSNFRTSSIDEQQNIFNIRTEYKSSQAKVTFSRSLATSDEMNDVSLNDCVYFLYHIKNGKLNDAGRIIMDSSNVMRSKSLICLGQCRTVDIETTATTVQPAGKPLPPPPGSLKRYRLRFDVTNMNITDELSNLSEDGSPELLHKMEKAVKLVLLGKFKDAQIHVSSLSDHQVDMEITAKNADVQTLYDVIIPAARQHRFYSYDIDPNSVNIVQLDQSPSAEEVRNYVIIAVISVFILLAIILTVCILWQARKRRSKYPPRRIMDKKRYVNQNYPLHYPKVFPMPMYEHARHYSSPSALTSKENVSNARQVNGHHQERVPPRSALNPMFTTTYGEWRERITPEGLPQPPPYAGGHPAHDATAYQYDSWQQPYVTYPTDSLSYYSLNGTQKMGEQSSSKGK
ncbi:DOMON domain containing protein [Trichuris trichiura]|uniref:DOMON domain containing protein n=1 Tax=Trichuris trichiura TaxID=36087 RepID=A0A077YVT2_TRITR|nr:DOMON domain containing protein [Trichuris trichiura]